MHHTRDNIERRPSLTIKLPIQSLFHFQSLCSSQSYCLLCLSICISHKLQTSIIHTQIHKYSIIFRNVELCRESKGFLSYLCVIDPHLLYGTIFYPMHRQLHKTQAVCERMEMRACTHTHTHTGKERGGIWIMDGEWGFPHARYGGVWIISGMNQT